MKRVGTPIVGRSGGATVKPGALGGGVRSECRTTPRRGAATGLRWERTRWCLAFRRRRRPPPVVGFPPPLLVRCRLCVGLEEPDPPPELEPPPDGAGDVLLPPPPPPLLGVEGVDGAGRCGVVGLCTVGTLTGGGGSLTVGVVTGPTLRPEDGTAATTAPLPPSTQAVRATRLVACSRRRRRALSPPVGKPLQTLPFGAVPERREVGPPSRAPYGQERARWTPDTGGHGRSPRRAPVVAAPEPALEFATIGGCPTTAGARSRSSCVAWRSS